MKLSDQTKDRLAVTFFLVVFSVVFGVILGAGFLLLFSFLKGTP